MEDQTLRRKLLPPNICNIHFRRSCAMAGMGLADRMIVFHIWLQGCALNRPILPPENLQETSELGKRQVLQKQRTMEWNSITCGNKMPTRCNRGFYCRSHCLLNMFRAPLCPSSGAQEYYTVVAVCGISCCGFQVVGLVWS